VFLALVPFCAVIAVAVSILIRSTASDLRSWAGEAAELEQSSSEGTGLDSRLEAQKRHAAAGQDIALRLCEDRLTLSAAIESAAVLAGNSPEWFARLRVNYRAGGRVSAAAPDRDVIVCYLRTQIVRLITEAEFLKDGPGATRLSARLALFDAEVRDLPRADE
jgi:hypothetical protein